MAVGKLCGRGQAVWPWASYVAVDKLCGSGELWGIWVVATAKGMTIYAPTATTTP